MIYKIPNKVKIQIFSIFLQFSPLISVIIDPNFKFFNFYIHILNLYCEKRVHDMSLIFLLLLS